MNTIQRSKWARAALIIIIGLGIGYAIFESMTKNRTEVEIGNRAPNFELANLQGEKVKLSDYRGQGVFLNFWATWCEPCINEMPLMNQVYKQVPGVEILAVNVGQKKSAVSQFADELGFTFPILLDSNNETKGLYKIGGLPVTILINEKGEIVDKITGELNSSNDVLDLMKKIQPVSEKSYGENKKVIEVVP